MKDKRANNKDVGNLWVFYTWLKRMTLPTYWEATFIISKAYDLILD